jgi:hypothetical protein
MLDGTTIEEVQKYHRDTLILCVDIANQQEKKIIENEKIQNEREKTRKKQHYNNVKNIADNIKF